MNKRYPRVKVRYNRTSRILHMNLWEARLYHGPDDDKGVYLVGDFGKIDYKWIAKRFLSKYPRAVSHDLRKMIG